MRFAIILAVCVVAATAVGYDEVILTSSLVDSVNRLNTTWQASTEQGSFFKGATRGQVMALMGVKKNVNKGPVLLRMEYPKDLPILGSFDSATEWPQCSSVTLIRDQSACGSCWAFGAAEAISDRYCTYSGLNAPSNVTLSANDLVACCWECGNGCNGGQPSAAWAYWVSTGLVEDACDPYPFPKCEHHSTGKYPACPDNEYPSPSCVKTCKNGKTWKPKKGGRSWTLSGESAMMQEIKANGPIEVAFTVYSDFLTYKSGVYQQVSGTALGGHAVRMVGWGTLNGVPYWKIANSWNEDWGANGYFLIKRGSDECGIEDEGTAGEPLYAEEE